MAAEILFNIVAYVIIGMGLLAIVWIWQGARKLNKGEIKKLFDYIMLFAVVCFGLAIWNFVYVTTRMDPGLYFINDAIRAIFAIMLFMVISRAALHIKKIGELYGFKE